MATDATAAFTLFIAVTFPFFGDLLGFFGGFAFTPTSYFVRLTSTACAPARAAARHVRTPARPHATSAACPASAGRPHATSASRRL